MGTKGRDLIIWCFIFTSLIGIIAPSVTLLTVDLFWAILIFYHYTLERKKVIRHGQVFLLPINPWWAQILVRGQIKGNWKKAYELHVKFDDKPLKAQLRSINQSFDHIRLNPGIYLWETYLPLPFPKNLREIIAPSTAFMKKGGFIPRPPFVYQYHQYQGRKLRHGAVFIPRKEALLCARKPL